MWGNPLTDKLEVHHIRALKDLKQYEGREKPQWVKIWPPGVAKRWSSVEPVTENFMQGDHSEKTITFSDGHTDDAGKRSAVKAACCVWRGAFGTGSDVPR